MTTSVGVPRETREDERRVALTPPIVPVLAKAGLSILIETEAGRRAGFPDHAYRDRGAEVVPRRQDVFERSDIVLQVRTTGANPVTDAADVDRLRRDQVVIGLANPLDAPEIAATMAARGPPCSPWT
jgi:NAD(P) transhydrogenase subunit alpha